MGISLVKCEVVVPGPREASASLNIELFSYIIVVLEVVKEFLTK